MRWDTPKLISIISQDEKHHVERYIVLCLFVCLFSLRKLKERFSREKLSIKMKNIILLDAAMIKTICHSSLKVLYNLNKNIKVMTTFNFRKWRQEKNYAKTYNFNITSIIILSNILFCNYSFIFLTLPTRIWVPWNKNHNKKTDSHLPCRYYCMHNTYSICCSQFGV